MTIYYAKHRRNRFSGLLYAISQPLTRRGMIGVGAMAGAMIGLIAGFCLLK